MTEHLHCIYCSARLENGATTCASCRSPVARVSEIPIASGARCPRCVARRAAGQLSRRSIIAECSLLECASCGGVMVELQAWGILIDAVEAGDQRLLGVGASTAAPLTLGDLLPLLTCPGCNRELDRVAFAGKSSVSVDVCNIHGIWLDAGELAKVLDLVRAKTSGAGSPPDDENANLTAEERREKVLQSMGIADPALHQHHATFRNPNSGFSANRLAGRVAFVAGGLEGAVAYGVLSAVASGTVSATQWAFQHSASEPEANAGAPQRRSGFELPTLRCLFCGASHRESDEACGSCNTPIARVTCPSCRLRVAAGEPKCRCGAPLLPDAHHEQMACPRCKSALQATDLDANTIANRCSRCLGSFFRIRDWTVVMDRTLTGNPLPLTGFVPLPPGRELPRAVLDAGAPCPSCRQPMERITFAMRSHVVVDICANHGMWLDAGELIALCNFMNQRNQPQPNQGQLR